MATMDDLFPSSGPKRPRSPKWNEAGDVRVGVIVEEPFREQEKNPTNGQSKWWNDDESASGRDKVLELTLSEGQARGLNPVMQIVVPVRLKDGELATFYFGGKKGAALKDAMQETDLPLDVGTTVGVKLTKVASNNARSWAIKLAKAE